MFSIGDGCPIVMDNGAGLMKAGFAGEDEPRVVFSPVIKTEEKQV